MTDIWKDWRLFASTTLIGLSACVPITPSRIDLSKEPSFDAAAANWMRCEALAPGKDSVSYELGSEPRDLVSFGGGYYVRALTTNLFRLYPKGDDAGLFVDVSGEAIFVADGNIFRVANGEGTRLKITSECK